MKTTQNHLLDINHVQEIQIWDPNQGRWVIIRTWPSGTESRVRIVTSKSVDCVEESSASQRPSEIPVSPHVIPVGKPGLAISESMIPCPSRPIPDHPPTSNSEAKSSSKKTQTSEDDDRDCPGASMELQGFHL